MFALPALPAKQAQTIKVLLLTIHDADLKDTEGMVELNQVGKLRSRPTATKHA